MTKVSYLVTVYNKALYLPYVLDSFLKQEGDFEREYIFVDDGSTDDSLKILKKFKAKTPGVKLVSQPNQGPAIAFNAGLKHCTGEYIKAVDADDVLLPYATQSQLDLLQKENGRFVYASIDKQLSYNPLKFDDTLLQKSHDMSDISLIENPLKQSLKSARTNPTSWMCETALLKSFQGCDEHIFIQDYSLELRFAASTSFIRQNYPIFAMPVELGDRLSGNQAQTLHDLNLAVLHFFESDLAPHSLKNYAYRRILKRALKWAKRKDTFAFYIGLLIKYIGVRLCSFSAPRKTIYESALSPFYRTDTIRLKGR